MLTSDDFIELMEKIERICGVDTLYEKGLEACIGTKPRIAFFNMAKDMDASQIIKVLKYALEETDEECEPIVDEFIYWLSEQVWFSNENFASIVKDSYIGSFVSGYRVIDGKLMNAEQLA